MAHVSFYLFYFIFCYKGFNSHDVFLLMTFFQIKKVSCLWMTFIKAKLYFLGVDLVEQLRCVAWRYNWTPQIQINELIILSSHEYNFVRILSIVAFSPYYIIYIYTYMHSFITESDETGEQIECQNHLWEKGQIILDSLKNFNWFFLLKQYSCIYWDLWKMG